MLDSCTKSLKYTQKVKLDLKNILYDMFGEHFDSICFLATGSFGKCQMTLESDIDLICILDNTVTDKKVQRDLIKKKLTEIGYRHTFEFYPIETLDIWKWIAQYSTLYCSDLFYAVPLAGNITIFQELIDWINRHNFEYLNRQSHFIYNLLYREQQLQNPKSEKSLKYQKGGLRDFQFLKWISRRMYNNQEFLPEDYLLPLFQSNLLMDNEYKMLVKYAESILGYKWDIEEGRKDKSVCGNTYENIRENVAEIVERVKNTTFTNLFTGSRYPHFYDTEDLNSHLMLKFDPQLKDLNKECMVLSNIWRIDDVVKLNTALQNYGEWWSVRASIALNPHCTSGLLNKIRWLKYPDMDDIVDFVLCNPNYEAKLI